MGPLIAGHHFGALEGDEKQENYKLQSKSDKNQATKGFWAGNGGKEDGVAEETNLHDVGDKVETQVLAPYL